ncbi:GNAT family N-acetyltransferase [Bauldia sp.]|uniref:GNAT family N-acetyltransferase n=1 Tax=Bauldia sp. TaxID=2575872 RepID=UPI003BAA77AC
MGDIAIRPPTGDDASDMAALMTALGYPASPDQMAVRLARLTDRADHQTLIATDGGQVVGMVAGYLVPGLHDDAPVGQIISLVVSETVRGRGVGRQLAAAIETWFRTAGVSRVSVTSHLRRKDAHAFYQGIGYAQTGLRFGRTLDDG